MLRPKIWRDRNGMHFGWIDKSKGFGATGRYFTSGPKPLRSFFRFVKAYPRVRKQNG